MKVQENLLNEERSVCSFSGDNPSDVYSFGRDGTCGNDLQIGQERQKAG